MRPSNLGWLDPFGSAKVRVSLSRTVLSVPPTLASSKSSSRSQSTSPPRIKTSPPPPGQNETSVFVQSHTFVPPWLGGRIWSYLRRPSIDVNFDFRRWSKHRSPFRHLRQWLPQNIIRSVDIRRVIFPDVIQVGLTASLITWYNGTLAAKTLEVLDTNGDGDVSMEELRAGIEQNLVEAHCVMGMDFFTVPDMWIIPNTTPFTVTSLALGMMLTFRTQHCHQRYTEARGLWGSLNNESRALSSRILAISGSKPLSEDVDRSVTNAVKCIMTFPRTIKYHVTVGGFCPDIDIKIDHTDAEVDAAKGAALRAELMDIWDPEDTAQQAFVERLLDPGVASRPLHVMQEITEIISQVFAKPENEGGLGLDPIIVNDMYRSVSRLQDVFGACERIYRTPVFTGSTSFTSRCVFLWTNSLPFALYPIMGPAFCVPTTMMISYFLHGLDDMSTRIEQPFDILPLWQYCDGIDAGCRQHLKTHRQTLRGIHS